MYVAAVLDLHALLVVGWALGALNGRHLALRTPQEYHTRISETEGVGIP